MWEQKHEFVFLWYQPIATNVSQRRKSRVNNMWPSLFFSRSALYTQSLILRFQTSQVWVGAANVELASHVSWAQVIEVRQLWGKYVITGSLPKVCMFCKQAWNNRLCWCNVNKLGFGVAVNRYICTHSDEEYSVGTRRQVIKNNMETSQLMVRINILGLINIIVTANQVDIFLWNIVDCELRCKVQDRWNNRGNPSFMSL